MKIWILETDNSIGDRCFLDVAKTRDEAINLGEKYAREDLDEDGDLVVVEDGNEIYYQIANYGYNVYLTEKEL